MFRRLTAACAVVFAVAAAGCGRKTPEVAAAPGTPLPPLAKASMKKPGDGPVQNLDAAGPMLALAANVK